MWLLVFGYLGAVAVAVALALATLKELCPLVCHLRPKQVDIKLYEVICSLFGGVGGRGKWGVECISTYRTALQALSSVKVTGSAHPCLYLPANIDKVSTRHTQREERPGKREK
jgi:hypothetical protein